MSNKIMTGNVDQSQDENHSKSEAEWNESDDKAEENLQAQFLSLRNRKARKIFLSQQNWRNLPFCQQSLRRWCCWLTQFIERSVFLLHIIRHRLNLDRRDRWKVAGAGLASLAVF